MRAIAFALLLITFPAAADSEARFGNDSVRFTAQPCADTKVLAHIAAVRQNPGDYRAASAEYQGATFAACWRPMFEQKIVVIVYDDGDQGLIPFSEIKPVKMT